LRYALPLAAMLAALVLLWTLGPTGGVDPALAAGLAEDHVGHHGPSGQQYLVAESDPQALSRWFEEQIGRMMSLPATPPEGRLVGGQICLVNGERVAHAVYDVDGTTVSYYMVPQAGPEKRVHGSLDRLNYLAWDTPEGGVFVLGSRPARELALFSPR
jgi:hypothetical protein